MPLTGFTLIETLVAVLILAMAITGPLAIASKGMRAALVAKDQTTAYYLAQDAIEYVRWVRDSNSLYNVTHPTAPLPWLAGLDGTSNAHTSTSGSCLASSGSCYIDSVADSVAACPVGGCPNLYYHRDSVTGAGYFTYTSTGNTYTIFKRVVTITTPIGSNSNEAQVRVQVYWQDTAGNTHPPITVYENIYNWQ